MTTIDIRAARMIALAYGNYRSALAIAREADGIDEMFYSHVIACAEALRRDQAFTGVEMVETVEIESVVRCYRHMIERSIAA